jgi:hypothetical protein
MDKHGEGKHFGTRKELKNNLSSGSHFIDE